MMREKWTEVHGKRFNVVPRSKSEVRRSVRYSGNDAVHGLPKLKPEASRSVKHFGNDAVH
jgi:hypothetical protein